MSNETITLPPDGEEATQSFQITHFPTGIAFGDTKALVDNPQPAGVRVDWHNDQAQLVIDEKGTDDPALHIRFSPEGKITEILFREDLLDTTKVQLDDGKPLKITI
jgi:hypothetical protein